MAPSDPRQTKFVLDEARIPRAWYNIAADLPVAAAPAAPSGHRASRSGRPTSPRSSRWRSSARRSRPEREIEIPEPVRDAYRLYRPSPLYRAHRLEKVARYARPTSTTSTRACSPAGSHKPNTAIAQAYYNKEEGVTRLATETGAGQWGSALAFAGAVFGLEVKVYMVRASYDQKPYRRILMETYGAEVVASPSLDDELRARGPRRDARQPGLARDRDQRGGRGRRDPRRHEVLARLGPQPRPAPPDGHRPGGDRADGDGRRVAGRHHRLHRRRLELRRADLPVPRPELPRRREVPDHRRRARGGAEPDPRRLRLRLRRHRQDDPAREDAHPRLGLHPRADPRRRAALPRDVAAGEPAQGARRHRGAERPPARELRGRRPVRPGRGDPARARSRPTPSRSRSTRRWRPRRPARRG